jgi:predicted 3-demethylubiquinone-9 3-methyltransferase (glyoxalase superfamily)
MSKITPFLWFDSQAEEAARFYCSIFRPSKLGKVARYPEGSPGPAGSVMTVEFQLDGQDYIALNGGPHFRFNEAVSFVINCKDQQEVDYYWDKLLADGGKPSQCGWLTDKFGLSWQVVPAAMNELFSDKDPARAQRAMQAMLKMVKLDLSALEAAADGRKGPKKKAA